MTSQKRLYFVTILRNTDLFILYRKFLYKLWSDLFLNALKILFPDVKKKDSEESESGSDVRNSFFFFVQ